MKGKRFLWTLFILTFLASTVIVSVPVSASPQTRVYVEMPAEGYINGTEIGVENYFTVDVYIENAVDLVQWALSVQVDPAVLEVCGATDGPGTVIYDYVDDPPRWPHGEMFVVGSVNKTEGKIIDISHAINQWPDLYPTPGGFNGSGKLCTLNFTVLDETAYSPIHLYNVLLFDGLYWETGTPHYFPPNIVEDGHYNPPPPPGGDAAVINVVLSFSEAYTTWTIQVNVTVLNNGTLPINCTVTAYYNASAWHEIGTQNVTLAEDENTTLTFNWNLTFLTQNKTYTVKANATLIDLDDIYLDNNEKVDGQVKIRLWGDINGNGVAGPFDFEDVGLMYLIYSEVITDPELVWRGDLNGNGVVGPLDFSDVGIMYQIYSGVL